MDQFFAMRAFEKVAELKSFTAAAETLGTTKGNLSRTVKALEDSLGTALLRRTTRRIGLTEAGLVYRERCARALEEAEAAARAVRNLKAEPRGRLRMSAPVNFGRLTLAPALPAFLLRVPELRIDLVLTNRFVDLVEEGFDLCVRIGVRPVPHLAAKRLAEFRWILCAAPSYLAATGYPRHPRDLAMHRILSPDPNLEHEVWRFQGPGGEARVPAGGHFRTNNVEVLAEAARAGAGIALVPSYTAAASLREGTLREVLPDWRSLSSTGDRIWAEFVPGRRSLPKVRAMLDLLGELFSGSSWMDDPGTGKGEPGPG